MVENSVERVENLKKGGEKMLGQYKATFDVKGRTSFPAKFREELGEHFYITMTLDQPCITVYSDKDWEDFMANLDAQPQIKVAAIRRRIVGNTYEAETDKQGRLVIPNPLREYACIETEATIVGLGKRAEIWSKQKWDEINSPGAIPNLVETAMELGL